MFARPERYLGHVMLQNKKFSARSCHGDMMSRSYAWLQGVVLEVSGGARLGASQPAAAYAVGAPCAAWQQLEPGPSASALRGVDCEDLALCAES